jgi:hypothetical protein
MPIPLPSLLFRIPILTVQPALMVPFLWVRKYVCVAMQAVWLGTDSDTAWDVGKVSDCAGWIRCHTWLTAGDGGTKTESLHQHGMEEG